jgi:hypothetical protein
MMLSRDRACRAHAGANCPWQFAAMSGTWRACLRVSEHGVGLIGDFEQAEVIDATGADLAAIARPILSLVDAGPGSPRRTWAARVRAPNRYLRSQPRQYRALFDVEGSAGGRVS